MQGKGQIQRQRQIQRCPPKRQAAATKSRAATCKASRPGAYALFPNYLVRFAERKAFGAITVAYAEKAWVREGVEGPQIRGRRVINERRRSGNHTGAHLKDIEIRSE